MLVHDADRFIAWCRMVELEKKKLEVQMAEIKAQGKGRRSGGATRDPHVQQGKPSWGSL